jgi:hypothetical protein
MAFELGRRQSTRAEWESDNPVIPNKQLVFTKDAGGTGIPLVKIGNGTDNWTDLPYINKRNNLEATTNPAVGDDSDDNYSVGSFWCNKSDTDNPDLYICTDATVGAAKWIQVNSGGGGGGGEDLGETLYNGNQTDGSDIVLTDGDVLDASNAGTNTQFITTPSGGYVRHDVAGYIREKNAGKLWYNISDELAMRLTDGVLEVGSDDLDGSVVLHDASSNNEFTILAPDITDDRSETLPDGDIDWTAGSGEDGYVMTWNDAYERWEAAVGGSGSAVDSVNGQTGAVILTEEDIDGTATYNGTMTGAVELDLATFTDIYGILTGNTAITVINTPASGETFARSMILKSDTTETLTLPVAWKQIGEFVNDGTEYDFEMKFTNYPTAGLKVVVYINSLA